MDIINNFNQFINENNNNRNEMIDFIEEYFNKHNINNENYIELNFEIYHNFSELKFHELYKYSGDEYGDFSFHFTNKNGKDANWYLSSIDIKSLSDIVDKLKKSNT